MQNLYGMGERIPMRMAEVTLQDPDVHRKDVPVDNRGRVVVGKQFAGKTVTVVAEKSDNE